MADISFELAVRGNFTKPATASFSSAKQCVDAFTEFYHSGQEIEGAGEHRVTSANFAGATISKVADGSSSLLATLGINGQFIPVPTFVYLEISPLQKFTGDPRLVEVAEGLGVETSVVFAVSNDKLYPLNPDTRELVSQGAFEGLAGYKFVAIPADRVSEDLAELADSTLETRSDELVSISGNKIKIQESLATVTNIFGNKQATETSPVAKPGETPGQGSSLAA